MDDRIKKLNKFTSHTNTLYIISRDQRIHENHAVLFSMELAHKNNANLFIGIEFDKIKMNSRQEIFILEGLVELESECRNYNLSLANINDLELFITENSIGSIVLDFNPMREYLKRQQEIASMCERYEIALFVCDSHNVVPCTMLSTYKRTPKAVRTDLYKIWNTYLEEYPKLEPYEYRNDTAIKKNSQFTEMLNKIKEERNEASGFRGGYKKGMKQLELFFKERLKTYDKDRNDPDSQGLSELSPYLHTGQISPLQVVLLTIEKAGANNVFINEVFIWRETAEHFVHHEKNYDNLDGALLWAKESLHAHKEDERKTRYDKESLENAKTNDALWNAAQNQLLETGKIHGYARMYWAKQLLRWTSGPEEALKIGMELNDDYAIDGNDPNGYLGVMWCICGSMDRAFGERPIFGKIRTMKAIKCPLYIQEWTKNGKR
ncbi:hypothetical protein GINT2_001548 [Glugoides intestinalis]